MPVSKQRSYHQNGGMFFLVDGKHSKEYENMDPSELYDLFNEIMKSATFIRMLSEFSLYGFVIEVFIDPMGPIKIMRQTRNVIGEPVTPKRASRRELSEQLNSFCLKIVGLGDITGDRSKQYLSIDKSKAKKKLLATFNECDQEVVTTRYVWDRMTRHNCAEVVPDACFGFDINASEFNVLFRKFITTPHDVSSHVIQWILDNFHDSYLTVMEMASGCDTLGAYIDRIGTVSLPAKASIKNASMEIIAYLIATWIRTGIVTTDGHSNNVMVNATGSNAARVHVSFNIYLLDLGRIFNRNGDVNIVIRPKFLKLFTKNTSNMIALRAALRTYFKCTEPLPTPSDTAFDASFKQTKVISELTTKFGEELVFVASLEPLSLTNPPTGLNIDQVKRAFKIAILCDIVTNAADYDHDYPQCVTVLESAFGIKITNLAFLNHSFNTTNDEDVFGTILSCVNRLLLPCHPGADLPSLRVVPTPPPQREARHSHTLQLHGHPPTEDLTDKVGDVVNCSVGGDNVVARVVPDDSKSSHAVKRSSSSSSSSDAAAQRLRTPYFASDYGGSRKNRRHKIRRGIKRSYSRSKHLRRSRNEKRRIRTTCRKYRRN
jgi:hypothetical protein